MRTFEPSKDFVSKVMERVQNMEAEQRYMAPTAGVPLRERFLRSRLFQWAMSGCGVVCGVFLIPTACI